jgi:hypothetical protein
MAAGSTATASSGTARSALTLLQVSLGGHTVGAGTIEAIATDAGSRLAQLAVTPLTLDGVAHGKQTVNPNNAPATVTATAQSVSVPNLLSLTGPSMAVDATSSATSVVTSAVLKAIGAIDLKPAGLVDLPITLQSASLSNISQVTATQSAASKTVSLGNLSLPSIDQLLSGLGVNISALLNQLTQGKLDALNGLVSSNPLTALNSAVDTAQAAVTNAPDTLAGAQALLTSSNSTLSQDNANLTAANSAFQSAFSAIPTASLGLIGAPTSLTPAGFEALSPTLQSGVDGLSSADLTSLASTATSAASAVSAAQGVVAAVNALVDALQALVNGVLGALQNNGDPLASLGNLSVVTKAVASGGSAAKPVASVRLGSLNVLGAVAPVGQLTSALTSVTSTLSGVLNSVAGVTFTPPAIALGVPHTSATKQGNTSKATAGITGLTLTLPSISMPQALSTVANAVPGATSIVNSVVKVLGGSLKVADLAESADFTPGTSSSSGSPRTPSTPGKTGQLPGTGMSPVIPAVAALVLVSALGLLHRRRVTATID